MGNRVESRSRMCSNYKFLPCCLPSLVVLGFPVRNSSELLLLKARVKYGARERPLYIFISVSIFIFILIPRVLAGLKRGPASMDCSNNRGFYGWNYLMS